MMQVNVLSRSWDIRWDGPNKNQIYFHVRVWMAWFTCSSWQEHIGMCLQHIGDKNHHQYLEVNK